MRKDCLWSLYL